jgi:hypothetical protein
MKNLKEIGLSGYVLHRDGKVYSLKVNRFLKPFLSGYDGSGYWTYMLRTEDSKSKTFSMHRLLAMCFIPNNDPENKIQVNHINGDKLDNRLENLEWVTPSENSIHANVTGLRTPTYLREDNKILSEEDINHDWAVGLPTDGITEEDVHLACSHLQDGYRVCDVSRMLVMDRRFIQKLRDDHIEKWHYIVKTYDFSKITRKTIASPDTVKTICEKLQEGLGVMEIARELNVNRKLVGNIKGRKFFKSISADYEF